MTHTPLPSDDEVEKVIYVCEEIHRRWMNPNISNETPEGAGCVPELVRIIRSLRTSLATAETKGWNAAIEAARSSLKSVRDSLGAGSDARTASSERNLGNVVLDNADDAIAALHRTTKATDG